MEIQTREAWNLEDITRQDLAVGDDDNYIGRKPADLFNGLWILDFCWLKDLKERRLPSRRTSHGGFETADPFKRLFYRWWLNALLAPDWLIRLSDDPNNFVFGFQQRS